MITKEQEDLMWSCIRPADNALTPEKSDGYNEGEVYEALCKLLNNAQTKEIANSTISILSRLSTAENLLLEMWNTGTGNEETQVMQKVGEHLKQINKL